MENLSEVIEYINDNDVKFVKLSFCDMLGRLKNISVNASHFEEVCHDGVEIDSSGMGLKMGQRLMLYPDIRTIKTMPWRPSAGAVVNVMCNIKHKSGMPFEGDCIDILNGAEKEFAKSGYSISFMTESEFYILKLNEHGEPTLNPVDNASYLDAAPFDKCENLRREIVFTLESMGMMPYSSHHEHGAGQNAVIFRANTPCKSAMNTLLFKSAVKNIANMSALYATFAPSPIPNMIGSNFRIVAEIKKNGVPVGDDELMKMAQGILGRLPDMAVFTNCMRNSYRRLLHKSTPAKLTINGELAALRTDISNGKIELLSADTACNPFIVLTLVMKAALEGAEGRAVKLNEGEVLPQSLSEAVELAKNSTFIAESLPREFLSWYIEDRQAEATSLKLDDILSSGL